MSETPTVVIRNDEDGNIQVYREGHVDIIWCDDRAPQDRLYRMRGDPIPDGLLDGEVGHVGDNSAASIRAQRALRYIEGRPAFDVITPETAQGPSVSAPVVGSSGGGTATRKDAEPAPEHPTMPQEPDQ